MTTKQIDLNLFCDPDLGSSRYPGIAAPFVRDGVRYATDGRILVAVPAPGEPDTEAKVPRAWELLPTLGGKAEWLPWPEIVPCQECSQTGQIKKNCRVCMGLGEHYCSQCDAEHECKACDDDGKQTEACTCRLPDTAVEINCRTIAHHYVYLAGTLPNTTFFADTEKSKDPLRFRFDGGEGVVMPMTCDK